MHDAPLDTGWTWWMVAFVVLVWLSLAAGAVALFVRTRRARRRRRGDEPSPSDRIALPPAYQQDRR